MSDQHQRMIEALLFASAEPLSEADLRTHLPEDLDVSAILEKLAEDYAPRGVNLIKVGGKWLFRTAPDLAFLLRKELEEPRRLSRAAIETLAIIAYHQPVTRAEIEAIRGVSLSKGTLDVLMEAGWVKPRGRKRVPGRPLTFGTTEAFLVHFGLKEIRDLPGIDELKAAGLLDHVNLAVIDFNDPNQSAELPLEDDAELAASLNEEFDGEMGEDEISPRDRADDRPDA